MSKKMNIVRHTDSIYSGNLELTPDDFLDIDERAGGEIVKHTDGSLTAYGFTLTQKGITPDNLPGDVAAWDALTDFIFHVQDGLNLWIGDLLNYIELRFGTSYQSIAEEFDYSVNYLYNLKYVMSRVDFSRRRENLSYSHYQAVAPLGAEEQEHWLTWASDNDLAANALRREIARTRQIDADVKRKPISAQIDNLEKRFNKKQWQALTTRERTEEYDRLITITRLMETWGFE